jgi:curved DNA-binding protein
MVELRDETDYYQLLQVSSKADPDTIRRVYDVLAARFHPDNWRTGDAERFQALNRAFEVLSDPDRKAQYDAEQPERERRSLPIFELEDFVYGPQGEMNRRLGILALLYSRCRANPDVPGLSVLDMENRMAFPRDYLKFTLWYLRTKGFIEMSENSDYTLTPAGADFLEANAENSKTIRRLLGLGSLAGTDRAEKPDCGSALVSGDDRLRRVA